MARSARLVIENCPHHLTQRGNNKQIVFNEPEDALTYLDILKKQSRKYGMNIVGYCLMPNHVHLIAIPTEKSALANSFGRTNYAYTQYFNRKYEAVGHLWQNRYFSCPLDDQHFWNALCYIEQNPVRANIIDNPCLFKWSSAKAHVTNIDETGLLDMDYWKMVSKTVQWERRLQIEESPETVKLFRKRTRSGIPFASNEFIRRLESKFGIKIFPNPMGRPGRPKK